MKKTLRKPENWQDFESLCKKLWGEIWKCPEIKKNGRTGQKQHGVDIYGIPKGESEYYGIQCKGKDDYTNATLTEKEVDAEIEKAKSFSPKLKKFYFATTANKDSSIEEYIRIKDLESRKLGLFEIHLFSWKDLVDLIEENKRTFDWFVKNINYKTSFSVAVTFQDDSNKLVFAPKLIRNHISYKLKQFEQYSFGLHHYSPEDNRKTKLEIATEPQPIRYFMNGTTYNKSSSVFSIRLTNTGNTAIKNFKLYFQFISEGIVVDTVTKQRQFLDTFKYTYDTLIYEGTTEGIFEPQDDILVQKDSIRTDDLCIRPTVEEPQKIEVKWQLVSEDFDENGSLFIEINPEIIKKQSVEEYEYPLEDEIRLENYNE
ncbi:MAG: hypothetical protein KAV44_06285 [Bacteroidales bacterium]|jgi:hypothetical protein|nr:hypothetical protein [Bacteroidales bacterium]